MKKLSKRLKSFLSVFFILTLFFSVPLRSLAFESSFNYVSGINHEAIAKLINFLNDKKSELDKVIGKEQKLLKTEKLNDQNGEIKSKNIEINKPAQKLFLLSAVLEPLKDAVIGKPKQYFGKVFCVAKDFVFPGACRNEAGKDYSDATTQTKKNNEEEINVLKKQYDDAIREANILNSKFNTLQQEIGKIKAGGVVIKEPIIEQKTVERTIEKIVSGLSQDDLSAGISSVKTELNNLNTNLTNQINNLSSNTSRQSTAAFQAISLTNRIDSLSGTRLSGITVNGVSGLIDSDIPDGITASNYLPLIGGTISGDLTINGNATLGVITLQNATAGYFTATSTAQASTFPYASTTALTISGSAYIGSLNGPLQANGGLVSATTSVGIRYGGTGQTSFGQGWLNSDGTTMSASTSPTVNYIIATSTTATSTFAGGFSVAGHCVTGDTKLRRRRRRRSKSTGKRTDLFEDSRAVLEEAEYIYDDVAIKDIEPGDEIASLDEETGAMVWSKVNALMDMGVKKIYKLTTASGKTIRTTAEHPYLVRKKEMSLSRSGIGVFFDSANIYHAQKKAGWLVGVDKLRKALEKAFNVAFINYYIAVPNETDDTLAKTLKFMNRIRHIVTFKQKILKYIPVWKDGEKKIEKKGDMDVDIALDVTETINDIDIALIISGDSDLLPLRQYVVKKGKQIVFSAFRHNTAWELTRNGKYIYLDDVKDEIAFDGQQGNGQKINSETELGVALTSLLYAKQQSLSTPLNNGIVDNSATIKNGSWTKVAHLKEGMEIAVSDADNNKAVWDSIAKIEILPEEQVYDIEIDGTHNFIGNDIIAHNTYIGGNIGIGTTSPSWKLSVAGIGSFDDFVRTSYFTATSTTASTFPYASTTAFTVSGNSYLGTVSSGTWNGALIGVPYGGTGWATIQSGSIPYGNGSSALSTTTAGTAGNVLALLNGVPTWTATTTLSEITGTLSVAKGGTGQTSFSQGWLNSDGTTLSASTSPTVAYITATSTTATSTLTDLNFPINSNLFYGGQRFLTSSTTAAGNLTIGYQSPTGLDANGGLYNTGVGYQALGNATSTGYNTAVGYQALKGSATISNAGYNTAVGYLALTANTTGINNIANGAYALRYNTTGSYNAAIGFQALFKNTTGSNNNAVGSYSLLSNTSGGANVGNGNHTLRYNTTGNNNTAIGFQAGSDNDSATTANQRSVIDNYMTFIGYQASRDARVASTTALTNGTAIGKNARVAQSNTIVLGGTGADSVNVVIGTTSPWAKLSIMNTYGSQLPLFDIASSTSAGYATSSVFRVNADGNIGIGTTSPNWKLSVAGIGSFDDYVRASYFTATSTTATSTFAGGLDLTSSTGQGLNFGSNTLFYQNNQRFLTSSTTAAGNLTIGYQSPTGLDANGGLYNTGVGYQALGNATSTGYNTAVGYQALKGSATISNAGYNTAVGYQALTVNTTGVDNTAVGYQALIANTTGLQNTAIGKFALQTNTTGNQNVAIGRSALRDNISGSNNFALGTAALAANTGSFNAALGASSFTYNTSGLGNIGLGYLSGAGDNVTQNQRSVIDTYMTFIGYQASRDASIASTTVLTNGTAIGKNAKVGGSNMLVLGGTGADAVNVVIGTTSPWAKLSILNTYGNQTPLFDIASSTSAAYATSSVFRVNADGNIGIGTTSPNWKLSVAGIGSFDDFVRTSYITATSTTATSTFAGGLSVAGSSGLTVLQNGYVGMGTQAPSSQFHVVSDVSPNNTVTSGMVFTRTALGGFGANGIGNQFLFQAENDAGSVVNSATLGAQLSYAVAGSEQGTLLFNTASAGVVGERMRIDYLGNIGIGTTSPYAKLSVSGDTALDSMFINFASSTATSLTLNYLKSATSTIPANTNYAWSISTSTTASPIFSISTQGSGANLNATTTINGGLNLDNGALVYDYSSAITTINSLEAGPMNFDDNAGIVSWFDLDITSASAVNTKHSYTAQMDSNPILTVYGESDGAGTAKNFRVGIGTTTPLHMLSIHNATTTADADLGFTATSTGLASFYNWTVGIDVSDAGKFKISSSTVLGTNDRLVIDGSGNVGIGTTGPDAKLQVVTSNASGATYGSTWTDRFLVVGATGIAGGVGIGWDSTLPAGIIQAAIPNTGYRNLALNPNGGNVGIGTTTPWRTLSVTGTVGMDGLTGATGAGSLCLDANKQVVYNSGSDACLSSTRATKHDIANLTVSGLSIINVLQPSSFIYNQGDGRTRYGFMAEDMALIDDRLTTHNEKGEITGIDDRAILSVAVKAIQEMNLKLISLEASVAVSTGTGTEGLFAWIVNKFMTTLGIVFENETIKAKNICVGETCVTEEQFKSVFGQSQSASSSSSSSSSVASPSSSSSSLSSQAMSSSSQSSSEDSSTSSSSDSSSSSSSSSSESSASSASSSSSSSETASSSSSVDSSSSESSSVPVISSSSSSEQSSSSSSAEASSSSEAPPLN